ncbi:hypothetical protein CPLU01_08187 [Colletotrichum plurivorum]|uniref:Uncharacterized protein n=1 Tax=Colletotrichum plurivorum TaxID=2175906 RepID=A0A8H6KC60_9PEZI|nr:hypothetical protein CPLU01_08187 [Colletotrichum plurivorum]
MEDVHDLPRNAPHDESLQRRGSGPTSEHSIKPFVGCSSPSEQSRPQTPSAPHITPSLTVAHGPTALDGQPLVNQDEERPFLSWSCEDVDAEPQEDEGIPTRSVTIQRKPVATHTSAQKVHQDLDESTLQSTGSITENTAVSIAVKPLWRVWALELVCILLSVLLFVVIILVLFISNNGPLPEWPLGITLNTFLALFATLAKAAFMIPVSVALSQTQWAWLNQDGMNPRPLYDLDVIDQASRGAWGSIVLLWRFRLRHFVALGALLVSISALISPVTQQAINYDMQATPVREEANTQVILNITAPRDQLKPAARQAAFVATFYDSSWFTEPLPYAAVTTGGVFCSTTNCTFNKYHSLGVCVKLANISSHLRVEEFEGPNELDNNLWVFGGELAPDSKVWKASLPGGYYMAHQGKMSLYTDMLLGNQTFGFQDNPSLQKARIASFALIHTTPVIYNKTWWETANKTEPTDAEFTDHIESFRHDAMEILFHLCVHTYDTEIRMGIESTQVVDSLAAPIDQDGHPFLNMSCDSMVYARSTVCRQNQARWNDTLYLEGPVGNSSGHVNWTKEEVFSANYHAMEDLARGLRGFLAGYAVAHKSPRANDYGMFNHGFEFIMALHRLVLFTRRNMGNLDVRAACLQNIYQNVATSLSASFRAGRPGLEKFTQSAFNVTGEARRDIPHVRVTWGWISLLAAEITMAALFLGLTIVYNTGGRESKFRDAKGSSLATLVALSGDCRAAAGGGLGPVSELERIAKGLKVRLQAGQIVLAKEAADETP